MEPNCFKFFLSNKIIDKYIIDSVVNRCDLINKLITIGQFFRQAPIHLD